MARPNLNAGVLAACSRRLARRLLTIGENRLALLTVEIQEEGGRLVFALVLALGMAAFGLLACITLTAAIVVLLWDHYPVAVLLALTAAYGASSALLGRKLAGLQRDWQMLSASLDQLRKDRACLQEEPD